MEKQKEFDFDNYKKNYGKMISRWMSLNLLPERTKFDFKLLKKIVKYRDDIMKYVNEGDFKQSYKNKQRSIISAAFKHVAKTEEEIEEYKKFSQTLSKDVKELTDKNKLYPSVTKLIPPWNDIITRGTKYIESQKTLNDDNYLKILMAQFIIYYVPLRPQIYMSLKLRDKFDKESNENYIYKKKDCYVICINNDKVSNKLGSSCSKLSEILTKCIDASLEFKKRDALFDDITVNVYGTSIRYVFQCTSNTLRSSFVINEFDKNKAYRDRVVVATKMRHSVQTALTCYNKLQPVTISDKDSDNDIIYDEYYTVKPIEESNSD